MSRNNLTSEQAESRLQHQRDPEWKQMQADVVIDTNDQLDQVRKWIRILADEIRTTT